MDSTQYVAGDGPFEKIFDIRDRDIFAFDFVMWTYTISFIRKSGTFYLQWFFLNSALIQINIPFNMINSCQPDGVVVMSNFEVDTLDAIYAVDGFVDVPSCVADCIENRKLMIE